MEIAIARNTMASRSRGRKKLEDSDTSTLPPRRSARLQSQEVVRRVISEEPEIANTPAPTADLEDKTRDAEQMCTWDVLPPVLDAKLPHLTREGAKLLHYKQKHLKSWTAQGNQLEEFCKPKSPEYKHLKNAIDATLVFAQEEAVCNPSLPPLKTTSN